MASKDAGNLRHLFDTFRILNVSDASTLTEDRFPFQNSFKKESYLLSDVDEELLLLVAFHDFVDLHSIKIHALPPFDGDTKSDDDDDDEDDDDEDSDEEDEDDTPSAPKEVALFKISDLSIDFNDVKDMKPTHSIKCSLKKMQKGQTFNLKKKSKIAVQFKKIKYLAIFIKSNQNETEKTFLSGIVLSGVSEAKLAYDMPVYKSDDKKKKEKYTDVVAMFDELDRKKTGLAQILRSNQSKLKSAVSNDTIHSLLSFISRIPSQVNTSLLHKIYINDNQFGSQWMAQTAPIYDESAKRYHLNVRPLYSGSPQQPVDGDYAEKMSFALMNILTEFDPAEAKEVHLFLDKQLETVLFHCLLTFHPSSSGNRHHSIEVLKVLLNDFPRRMYRILSISASDPLTSTSPLTVTSCSCHLISTDSTLSSHDQPDFAVIQDLFHYAVVTHGHCAKFAEFLLTMLLYDKGNKMEIAKLRQQWISKMKEWQFLESVLEIAASPNVYGDDMANTYCSVIATLSKQCATMKETAILFESGSSDRNWYSQIMEMFMKGALDTKSNGKWYRIQCLGMAIRAVSELCDTKVVELKRKRVIKSSDNHLYGLSDGLLQTLKQFVPALIEQIAAMDTVDVVQTAKTSKPLGLYRLKCLELLVLFMETMMKRTKQFGDIGMGQSVDILCKSMVEMALLHINNNLFLVQLKRFVDILGKHCNEKLKYLMVECGMVSRFIAFYESTQVPSALKSFILAILWEMKDKANGYLNTNGEAKRFMSNVVEKQIELQQTKEAPKV